MKLTILGNNGPYPKVGGACSGYLVSSDSGKTNIVVEMGTGSLANLRGNIACSKVDAVLLSHLHYDHMSDMLPMVYALQFDPPKKPIPVYAPESPAEVLGLLKQAACYDVRTIGDVQIGEMKISVMKARHPVETYGMRIECDGRSLGYTGDSNETEGQSAFFEGCDVLLADAGLSEADWSEKAPHFSAAGCGQLARNAKVGKLLLTHVNPRYAEADLEREARGAFECASFTVIGESYRI